MGQVTACPFTFPQILYLLDVQSFDSAEVNLIKAPINVILSVLLASSKGFASLLLQAHPLLDFV